MVGTTYCENKNEKPNLIGTGDQRAKQLSQWRAYSLAYDSIILCIWLDNYDIIHFLVCSDGGGGGRCGGYAYYCPSRRSLPAPLLLEYTCFTETNISSQSTRKDSEPWGASVIGEVAYSVSLRQDSNVESCVGRAVSFDPFTLSCRWHKVQHNTYRCKSNNQLARIWKIKL